MTMPDTREATTAATVRQQTDLLLAELHAEAEKTRRLLERLPEDRLSWKPHARSMSLGQLALHIAGLPLGIAMLAEPLTTEVPDVPLTEAQSRQEAIALLERSVQYAADRLSAWRDEGLRETWTLTAGGAPLMQMPRGELLRALMFNHVYHHRGQLTVYLRLLDVAVPPTFGPTADENPFG